MSFKKIQENNERSNDKKSDEPSESTLLGDKFVNVNSKWDLYLLFLRSFNQGISCMHLFNNFRDGTKIGPSEKNNLKNKFDLKQI